MTINNVLVKDEPKKNETELVGVTMSATRLSEALIQETEKRSLIQQYIQKNLIDGTDFGKININGRDSKYCLFKSGAEKICSLLHLKPVFKIDNDLKSIVGEGVIPYICELINRHTGEIEGEGRGSCSLKEKSGNANIAIKISQKRAQIDAVLRVAALSGQFTQDLEDFDNAKPAKSPSPVTPIIKPKNAPVQKISQTTGDAATVCQFGKNKGKPWAELSYNSLEWYSKYFEDAIADPDKAEYLQKNEECLRGVMTALLDREAAHAS